MTKSQNLSLPLMNKLCFKKLTQFFQFIQSIEISIPNQQTIQSCIFYRIILKLLTLINMEKLKEAKDLTIQADNCFNKQLYKQAIIHYTRIISILENLLSDPFVKNSLDDIRQKIVKYSTIKNQVEHKLKQHQSKIPKKQTNTYSLIENQHQQIHKKNIGNKVIPQKKPFSLGKPQNINKQTANNNKSVRGSHQTLDKNKIKPEITKLYPPNLKNPIPIPNQKRNTGIDKLIQPIKIIQPLKKLNKKVEVPKGPKDKGIEPQVKDLIIKNIDVTFESIVGLNDVKSILEESVIRPRKRPDLYQGIRAPPRGLLLYGPPGNGKTFICKALAHQSGCTFFALSASAIMNKYLGESEKMIKKIFKAAEQLAPSIIFIDEIDSMLTARSEHEHQASRRLKTQFLVLMDGISSPKSGEIIVIGATNLPKQLDNAAKRRFSKFIYIGNPDSPARQELVTRNLKGIKFNLTERQMEALVQKLDCFSASEIRNICVEVCNLPLREISESKFQKISGDQLRNICYKDFVQVLKQRKPIVSREELLKYKQKI